MVSSTEAQLQAGHCVAMYLVCQDEINQEVQTGKLPEARQII